MGRSFGKCLGVRARLVDGPRDPDRLGLAQRGAQPFQLFAAHETLARGLLELLDVFRGLTAANGPCPRRRHCDSSSATQSGNAAQP